MRGDHVRASQVTRVNDEIDERKLHPKLWVARIASCDWICNGRRGLWDHCTGEIIEAHAQGKHTGKGLQGARLVYVVRVRIQQR